METERVDIFEVQSTEQLKEYKQVLLNMYNSAESRIHSGNPRLDDYRTLTEAENTLHRVQRTLDRRGE